MSMPKACEQCKCIATGIANITDLKFLRLVDEAVRLTKLHRQYLIADPIGERPATFRYKLREE
jgi:hypothetical protein